MEVHPLNHSPLPGSRIYDYCAFVMVNDTDGHSSMISYILKKQLFLLLIPTVGLS